MHVCMWAYVNVVCSVHVFVFMLCIILLCVRVLNPKCIARMLNLNLLKCSGLSCHRLAMDTYILTKPPD